jgi:hypothetical protein
MLFVGGYNRISKRSRAPRTVRALPCSGTRDRDAVAQVHRPTARSSGQKPPRGWLLERPDKSRDGMDGLEWGFMRPRLMRRTQLAHKVGRPHIRNPGVKRSNSLIRANQCRKLLGISLPALTADLGYPKSGATCERSRRSFVLGNHRFHRQRNHASSCCRLPPVARSSTPRRRIDCARERGRPVRGGEVRTGSLHGPRAYPSGSEGARPSDPRQCLMRLMRSRVALSSNAQAGGVNTV